MPSYPKSNRGTSVREAACPSSADHAGRCLTRSATVWQMSWGLRLRREVDKLRCLLLPRHCAEMLKAIGGAIEGNREFGDVGGALTAEVNSKRAAKNLKGSSASVHQSSDKRRSR